MFDAALYFHDCYCTHKKIGGLVAPHPLGGMVVLRTLANFRQEDSVKQVHSKSDVATLGLAASNVKIAAFRHCEKVFDK